MTATELPPIARVLVNLGGLGILNDLEITAVLRVGAVKAAGHVSGARGGAWTEGRWDISGKTVNYSLHEHGTGTARVLDVLRCIEVVATAGHRARLEEAIAVRRDVNSRAGRDERVCGVRRAPSQRDSDAALSAQADRAVAAVCRDVRELAAVGSSDQQKCAQLDLFALV